MLVHPARRKLVDLKGKHVVLLGEREGIPGPALASVVKSAGGDPVMVQTFCFV